jgi:hypothetical protein
MTLPLSSFVDPSGLVIERLTRVAPLGLRFWDPVTSTVIGSGLIVSAYLPSQPDQRFQADANRSGVYVFHHLPLLQEIENGSGDVDYWANLPHPLAFRIEVSDPGGRFLPLSFSVNLPHHGLYAPDCKAILSLLLPNPYQDAAQSNLIPLFSAPTRIVPAGMAVVRSELHLFGSNQPVAWALIEVTPPGRAPVLGVSNNKGQVAVLFPYPEPQQIGTGSPPGPGSPPSGRRSLTDQFWQVKVQVFAEPGGPVTSPVQSPVSGTADLSDLPDLCQVLKQLESPPAQAWAALSPLIPLGDQTLEYGKELIISSQSFMGFAQSLSELMITLV